MIRNYLPITLYIQLPSISIQIQMKCEILPRKTREKTRPVSPLIQTSRWHITGSIRSDVASGNFFQFANWYRGPIEFRFNLISPRNILIFHSKLVNYHGCIAHPPINSPAGRPGMGRQPFGKFLCQTFRP